jgi:hypothetical protein
VGEGGEAEGAVAALHVEEGGLDGVALVVSGAEGVSAEGAGVLCELSVAGVAGVGLGGARGQREAVDGEGEVEIACVLGAEVSVAV